MIAFEGDVKLTDFGIAKARGFLTDKEGEVVAGKADYMSPEQANFQITDKRSDLFSAGVVLAHLLLGTNIFKGANPEESRERIMTMSLSRTSARSTSGWMTASTRFCTRRSRGTRPALPHRG